MSTGHIIARDCITDTLNPHWEGDINDQRQACDADGTLTECTRCNIVWHASCLQPPLLFPLRKQDAIICGDACWAELLDEYTKRGTPEPVKEDPLDKPSFLPRRHSVTTPTEHDYSSVTSRTPQGGSPICSTASIHGQRGAPPIAFTPTRGRKRRARGERKDKEAPLPIHSEGSRSGEGAGGRRSDHGGLLSSGDGGSSGAGGRIFLLSSPQTEARHGHSGCTSEQFHPTETRQSYSTYRCP